MLEKFNFSIVRLMASAVITMTAAIYGATLAQADDLKFVLNVKCGVIPKGKTLYNGRFHREIAGETFEYIPSWDKSKSVRSKIQKRYAVLKGASCWIEFMAPVSSVKSERATGRFVEAYRYHNSTFLPEKNVGLVAKVSVLEFFIDKNKKASECWAEYLKAGVKYEALGRNATSDDISVFLHAQEVSSSCLDLEIQNFDDRGFVGVWQKNEDVSMGFAWLDGVLYTYGGGK